MGSDNKPVKENGLPKMGPDDKPSSVGFVIIISAITLAIGTAIAFAILSFGDAAKYNANINELVKKDLHWVCAAVIVLGRTIAFVNM